MSEKQALTFRIEQIAICPVDPEAARKLLEEIGAERWIHDHVRAEGSLFGAPATNEADLAFNYTLMNGGNEFEILHYTKGDNWATTPTRFNSVSHLGMHCDQDELKRWRVFFEERGIGVAQEVVTNSHTNAAIKDTRRYNYVIFDTKSILGVDLKFIVRLPA